MLQGLRQGALLETMGVVEVSVVLVGADDGRHG